MSETAKLPLLIYHGKCPDGFGAAYSFWKKYKNEIEYIALDHVDEQYKGLLKSVFEDRKVWMVDISLERDDAIEIRNKFKTLEIIDHHISAQRKLSDLDFCKFDMSHSGAYLAWDYCFGDSAPLPKLLQYIEDRDLYTWRLPYAKEILAAVDSYPRNFETWEKLDERIEDPHQFAIILEEGAAILRYNKVLMNILKAEIYFGEIKGDKVPIINTPFFRSELLNELCLEHKDCPFAAGYHYDGEFFVFSLRSAKDKADVSEIAAKFHGGGGHKNAAGFRVKSLDELV